ncbi:hypothetical protein B0T18DRAFT_487642 [Schizothecium vesticola]|uniref:Uncharacterized protein n=1 Tax=Schizothecium vesticola TaxID=314040 RepID=A0AA40F2S5_9PEZI|nr:hypothetical protein B0T18DRAFT_487642 [Schizothecium vesticola]
MTPSEGVQQQESRIGHLERQLKTVLEGVQRTESRICHLERQLKAARRVLGKWSRGLATSKEKSRRCRRVLRKKASRALHLGTRLEHAQGEVDGKDLQISTLDKTVKGQQAEIARLREELKVERLSVAHVRVDADRKGIENGSLQSQVKDKQADISQPLAQLHVAEEKTKAAEAGKAIFSNPMMVAMCRGLAGCWLPSLQLEQVAELPQGPTFEASLVQPAT